MVAAGDHARPARRAQRRRVHVAVAQPLARPGGPGSASRSGCRSSRAGRSPCRRARRTARSARPSAPAPGPATPASTRRPSGRSRRGRRRPTGTRSAASRRSSCSRIAAAIVSVAGPPAHHPERMNPRGDRGQPSSEASSTPSRRQLGVPRLQRHGRLACHARDREAPPPARRQRPRHHPHPTIVRVADLAVDQLDQAAGNRQHRHPPPTNFESSSATATACRIATTLCSVCVDAAEHAGDISLASSGRTLLNHIDADIDPSLATVPPRRRGGVSQTPWRWCRGPAAHSSAPR